MDRFRRSALIVATLACLLAAGCTVPPTLPTAQSHATATSHASPHTQVPAPTSLPTENTAPPDPAKWCLPTVPTVPQSSSTSLIEAGLYIAYFSPSGTSYSFVVSSPQGEVKRALQLTDDAVPPSPNSPAAVSPDGQYFVYYAPWPSQANAELELPHDLALHIARTADGGEVAAIPLLTPDFPDNFRQSAEAYLNHPPPGFEDATFDELERLLKDAFFYGIRSVAWSPDSQTLAFAGELDGPSSDIYTYEVPTGALRRLTSGPEQIVRISWSPDGTWIAHGSATWLGVGTFVTNHAVTRDGSKTVDFPFGGQYDLGWLTPTKYLVGDDNAALGTRHLSILDIEAGSSTPIWQAQYYAVAFADSGSSLLVTSIGAESGHPPEGLYVIDTPSSAFTWLEEGVDWRIASWGNEDYQFLISNKEAGVSGLAADGSATKLLDGAWTMVVSPDKAAVALFTNPDMPGLHLLDSSSMELRTLSTQDAASVTWSPDSSHLLASHGTRASAITFTVVPRNGDAPRLVYSQPPGMCFTPSISWIIVPG